MSDPGATATSDELLRLATADFPLALAVAADPAAAPAALECLVWRREPVILAELAARALPPFAPLAACARSPGRACKSRRTDPRRCDRCDARRSLTTRVPARYTNRP